MLNNKIICYLHLYSIVYLLGVRKNNTMDDWYLIQPNTGREGDSSVFLDPFRREKAYSFLISIEALQPDIYFGDFDLVYLK